MYAILGIWVWKFLHANKKTALWPLPTMLYRATHAMKFYKSSKTCLLGQYHTSRNLVWQATLFCNAIVFHFLIVCGLSKLLETGEMGTLSNCQSTAKICSLEQAAHGGPLSSAFSPLQCTLCAGQQSSPQWFPKSICCQCTLGGYTQLHQRWVEFASGLNEKSGCSN